MRWPVGYLLERLPVLIGLDLTNLLIAIHITLQVFRPNFARSGILDLGLTRFRYGVYALAATLPGMMASLAFVNRHGAYQWSGVYCSLPVRPFWYRLALSWIPRYIILIAIASMYVAIYVHARHSMGPMALLRAADTSDSSLPDNRRSRTKSAPTDTKFLVPPQLKKNFHSSSNDSRFTEENKNGLAEQRQTQDDIQLKADITQPYDERDADRRESQKRDGDHRDSVLTPEGNGTQKRILKQIRNLFAYPIVYFMIWLFPLINHLCTYDYNLAQHPVFPLVILNSFSISIFGAVDSLVFCLQERPWRRIANTDGTLIGSFRFKESNNPRVQRSAIHHYVASSNRSAPTGTSTVRPSLEGAGTSATENHLLDPIGVDRSVSISSADRELEVFDRRLSMIVEREFDHSDRWKPAENN